MQNIQRYPWDEETVNRRLEERMRTAHREVAAFAAERGIDLRTAALALAIGRVVEANAKLGRMADPAEAGRS